MNPEPDGYDRSKYCPCCGEIAVAFAAVQVRP